MVVVDIVGVFLIALVISYLITPFMAYIATKANLMDHPTKKKAHAHATPLLGGLAIYIAFIIAILSTAHVDRLIIGALVGGTVLILMGIFDDKYGMMPNVKILGQLSAAVIAALIAARMGLKVVFIKNAPFIAIIFTLLWVIWMTNAFNLLDNLNGLSAGIAGISAFFFGTIAFINGDIPVATVSFALMGGCLGFLKHNFPKAKIFMGDAGSLFLGFMLAFIAVWGNWKTFRVITSLAIPILILGYPIFDTALVTIKRIQEGHTIFKGGQDHSSHRLAILGLKKKRAVLVLYALSFGLGLTALAVTFAKPFLGFIIIGIVFMAMLILGIRLGSVRIKHKN